ncbi:lipase family protein [Rhodococcus sp. NPDC058521]|uniref:lipase family protein n=1 Tax=Rhodococcus sp. NPDC058521 TaxID=3346536 RepID=UPI0036479148
MRLVPTAMLVALALAVTPVVAQADPKDGGLGAVPRTEELPAEFSLPAADRAYRITYDTLGIDDRPAVSTGAVFVPAGEAPEGGWPVLSWAHGTVGIGDDCAPSTNPRSVRDVAYLDHWLSQGYAVVATDYVGLGTPGVHPYLDSKVAAHNVVDMVRAGRAAVPALSNKWMAIGQSQGGHATVNATHEAMSYAPELDFRGGVATGAPSNLEHLYPYGDPAFPELGLDGLTTFSTYILAGMRAAQPHLDVNSYLTPLGAELVDSAESLCYDDQAARVEGVATGALLSRSLNTPEFRSAITDYLAVPTTGYDRPMFIGQGLTDTVVPAPLSFALVPQLLAGGASVDYRTYPTDHNGTMAASLPDSTPFVAAAMR